MPGRLSRGGMGHAGSEVSLHPTLRRRLLNRVTLRVEQLPHARDLEPPAYMSEGAAGMDLRAAVEEPARLEPGDFALIPTGIRIALPAGYEGQVRPRSGLATSYGVTVLNAPGTVDTDYRGEVKVLVINHGREAFVVRRGDRMAQLVISPVARAEVVVVEELDRTVRGGGGFGHTGQ